MLQRDVLADYERTKSIKATAKNLHLSDQTVRRVLTSNGIYVSERSKEVTRLRLMGMTVTEIAEYLKISTKAVKAHFPYTKGSYVIGTKSKNAEAIARCRAKKEKGES